MIIHNKSYEGYTFLMMLQELQNFQITKEDLDYWVKKFAQSEKDIGYQQGYEDGIGE